MVSVGVGVAVGVGDRAGFGKEVGVGVGAGGGAGTAGAGCGCRRCGLRWVPCRVGSGVGLLSFVVVVAVVAAGFGAGSRVWC